MSKLFTIVVTALCLVAGGVRAQDAWVQIEARPTLSEAEDRARAWNTAFPDVNGFRLASGWYAIALGPYAAGEAAERLGTLTSERLVPDDSFVSDGGNFRNRFWPVGGEAATRPAQPARPRPPADQVIAVEPPVAVLVEETPAEARRSEAALGAAERMELQTALEWFGFYDGGIDGAFGRGTRNSMAAWQRANGYEATGVLTTTQRNVLRGAHREALAALGLGHVSERRAGIDIDMPIELVEFDDYAPPFVRYHEKDGSGVRVLLISQEGTQATLDGLFDAMQTLEIVPLEGLRERQGDHFVLTGQNDRIHSYTYAQLANGMVKGFTLAYPAADEQRMARAVQIMRDSLRSTGPALDPTLGDDSAEQSRDLLAGLEIRQPARTRSGLYVDGRGAVLTVSEAVAGCGRVTLDGLYDATVVAEDSASGLALLRPQKVLAPAQVAGFARAEPRIGTRAAVAGYPFGPALPAASIAFGKVEDVRGLSGEPGLLRLSAEAEAGEAGGPVFDAAGAVAGLLLPPVDEGARALPPGVFFAAKAEVIAEFLEGQGIEPAVAAPAGAMAPEDVTRAAMAMTVLVSCWE